MLLTSTCLLHQPHILCQPHNFVERAHVFVIDIVFAVRLQIIMSMAFGCVASGKDRMFTAIHPEMFTAIHPEKSIRINIKLDKDRPHVMDKSFTMAVTSRYTIADVKTAIYERERIPILWQRLVHFNGDQLDDNRLLSDELVLHASELMLVVLIDVPDHEPMVKIPWSCGTLLFPCNFECSIKSYIDNHLIHLTLYYTDNRTPKTHTDHIEFPEAEQTHFTLPCPSGCHSDIHFKWKRGNILHVGHDKPMLGMTGDIGMLLDNPNPLTNCLPSTSCGLPISAHPS